MRKQALMVCALACAIAMPLAGCSGTTTGGTSTTGGNAQAEQSGDFDAVEAYWGKWRGSVEITGTTVYGTAGGTEPMLDVNLNEDGTCEVVPLEAHADLLTDEGTWEGTESEITLHLSSGDIVLTVVDKVTCEADAAAFDIADFDTIQFDFFG